MKVCPVCGTEYGDEAAFCSRDRSSLRPVAAESSAGLVGQLVGERYQVERRLGQGGMGEVYLARHVLMGRPCALKVMNQALSQDPDAVSRFNREATNASRISHPNVCAVYDFGLTPDGLVYLAMEFVEGRALSAVLDDSGPLPVQRAAELVAQCAHGLQVAHDLGIVHRDLKPDNIMVTPGKDREVVKLVDFGIAKAADAGGGQRVTRTGFVVGTPEYMAPEQLAGDPLDGRSDQYGLALVFYRAITGVLPFEGTSAQETLVKRLTDPPRPLAVARPDVPFPAGLQGVMDRALARDPDARYPTVTAFAEAVSAITRGDAVATRPLEPARPAAPMPLPPTRQASRTRVRAGIPLLVAGGATIAVVAAWLALQPGAGTQAPVPAPVSAPASLPPAATPTPPPAPPLGSSAPSVPSPGRLVNSGVTAESTGAGTLDTAAPDPEQFDDAKRRDLLIARERQIMNSPGVPLQRRARAAANLGHAALRFAKNRRMALDFFQRAQRLFPTPGYASMIRQLQDSVPE
ncbi:MAG TPA: protein kinase [Gemmatimonadales bacterium]|nr:protein kinase [Gemmatimonadales bacterium]